MQATDTPPDSPLSPANQSFSRHRIHIDDKGVHDFDSKRDFDFRRPTSSHGNKLRKFSRQSQPSSISSTRDMAIDLPQRTPSDGSDTASLRKRFSALLPGNRSSQELQKSNSISSRSAHSSIDFTEDPLPDTKKELEVRLNYHLSELDILKKTINAANDVIRQHSDRYEILQTRGLTDMRLSMQTQELLIHQARKNRDSWADFVSFHRRQLERIKHKRIEIEREAGLEPTLPQVYKQMWGDEEWQRLFLA